jgi:hypothetical protein
MEIPTFYFYAEHSPEHGGYRMKKNRSKTVSH